MIQRIQSIWFLLAGVTIACLLFFPMVTASTGEAEYYVLANGLFEKIGNNTKLLIASTPLLLMTIAVALMSIANIFNFKNRTTQKRLAYINIVFIIALSLFCSIYSKKIPGGLETANYNVGMFLPVVAIFFCILGVRGINNDEKLLKSADRLR
jgi:peptidoglycan/LPS O-acetylase OafA/YrhL